MTFSVSISASICLSIFDGKWLPKWMSATSGGAPFFHYFHALASILFAFCPKAVFRMHFGRPLAPFWIHFVPFWRPLAHFCITFGALWLTFGALGLTFGALGVTFAHAGARFSHFWCLLVLFFIYLYIFR